MNVFFENTRQPRRLVPFSDPEDLSGYKDKHIQPDMVTEIYTQFGQRSREMESTTYL